MNVVHAPFVRLDNFYITPRSII